MVVLKTSTGGVEGSLTAIPAWMPMRSLAVRITSALSTVTGRTRKVSKTDVNMFDGVTVVSKHHLRCPSARCITKLLTFKLSTFQDQLGHLVTEEGEREPRAVIKLDVQPAADVDGALRIEQEVDFEHDTELRVFADTDAQRGLRGEKVKLVGQRTAQDCVGLEVQFKTIEAECKVDFGDRRHIESERVVELGESEVLDIDAVVEFLYYSFEVIVEVVFYGVGEVDD